MHRPIVAAVLMTALVGAAAIALAAPILNELVRYPPCDVGGETYKTGLAPHEGSHTYYDVTVDLQTGTVRGYALTDNITVGAVGEWTATARAEARLGLSGYDCVRSGA